MASLIPFIRNLHIVDKEGVDHRLGDVLTWAQLDLLHRLDADLREKRPSRVIILKARQLGMSTVIEAVQFALLMSRPNFRGLVIAHENDSSAHLLGMTRYYYNTFWARDAFPTRHAAVNQMAWQHVNSHVKIATAKNLKAGRSRTLQFLHCSEIGFWDMADTLMTGLQQTVGRKPGTFIFLESTANGVGGYFYDTWDRAMSGKSSYIPLFYPWWNHPEYTADAIGLGFLAEGRMVFMDDEERFLHKFLSRPRTVNGRELATMSNAEIRQRLVWRREILGDECKGDLNKLHQEYPSDPEEAFIATGTNVFDLNRLKKVYEPIDGEQGRLVREAGGVRFIADANGPLTIYRDPSASRQFGFYMVGGDPKKAVEGDWACAQVINRKTWEQVAELRIKCDQNQFGEQMIMLGQFYNNAMLAPETGMGGGGVTAHIIAKGYPHIWQHRKANTQPGQLDRTWGWISNAQTKPEAIGNVQSALFDATTEPAYTQGIGMRIHSPQLFSEMKHYVTLPNGGFGNAQGIEDHDDTVMAWAIALTCTKYEALSMASDPAYEAPRYHARDYESTLRPDQTAKFEAALGAAQAGEGAVMTDAGFMEGAGVDVPWLEQTPDFYGEADE